MFEDGSDSLPDLDFYVFNEKTGDRVDPEEFFHKSTGEPHYAKLEELRNRIAHVLRTYRITVLNKAVQDLEVPDLSASEEVYLSPPLRVRDAFFFHGV